MAKELKGTKTHGNLKEAFAGESQANRRYLYFANWQTLLTFMYQQLDLAPKPG